MRRLVPEFIQDKYAAGKIKGSFEACALFIDISGFTNITEAIMGHGRHGAEVLANLIKDVFDPLVKSVFAQGGFVTNLAGDAFTAVFPADTEPENHFQRALAAAWQLQQVMRASSRHKTPYGNFTVSAKVGLAAGQVNWGIITSKDKTRASYYFQGSAIEGCTYAEKLAQAGDIIVDAAVLEAVGSMVSADLIDDNRKDSYHRITALHVVLPPAQPVNLYPVDPDITALFFPAEAAQTTVSGEFRQVVSMFVNLPTVQEVEQLEVFMQTVFELQDRYGGLLNRVDFGDKGASLLLFWGAPLAYENDVLRALNFVLELQSQTVIPVNVGITYRIAHGGYSGSELAGEFTSHGRGITLAARFMQTCPRGEIWLDEHIAERAEENFEIEFEGEMSFKGFIEKQKVFVLLERKERSQPFFMGTMVGRQIEQQRLLEFLKPIWRRQYAGLMLIKGEPGIGKSRLVHGALENLDTISDREYSLYICQTDEILRESLNPFRYWLYGYFAQSEQQSKTRNKRRFNRKLDRLISILPDEFLASELDRTRSFLGALVNLAWPDSLYEQLDAQGRYENSLTGLRTLIQAESYRRPVILLLEDVHWLDSDSKDFLNQLTRSLDQDPSFPIAFLATARPGGNNRIVDDDVTLQEIDLGQISQADLAAIASDQLGSPIGVDLLELLAERSEGNPFFAEQILRYLQEQNELVLSGNGWELGTEQELALPSDVNAVLVARLDQLTHAVKEVVQTASVLGREFEIRLLSHMLDDDPEIEKKVIEAEHLSIWLALTELRYLFKHTLLRDAAYEMQAHSRRQSLHKLAAEALENIYEKDLGPHYGELAYHAEQADLRQKARRYLELAAKVAKDAYQNRLAVDYLNRALKLTPVEDLESQYRILVLRERLYARQGARQEQWRDLNELTALAKRLGDEAEQGKVLVRKAWLYWWTADYQEALDAADQAKLLAEEIKQPGLTAQADHVSTWAMIQQGDYAKARQLAEKSLSSARQSGDHDLESNSLHSLALIHRVEGDYFTSLKRAEEALALNRSIADLPGESTSLGNLGVVHMTLGDFAAAKDSFQQALAMSREVGSRVHIGSDLINLSWNAETQGQWESALMYGEEGIAIVRSVNQAEMVSEALIWLGHTWSGLGQPEKAFVAYEESLRLRRELSQEYLAMEVLAGMARLAVRQDDLDSALDYVTEIISHLDDGGSFAGTWEPLRIYLTCYQVLRLAQNSRAIEILKTAHHQLQVWANKIPNMAKRTMFLENILWHREIVAAYQEGE